MNSTNPDWEDRLETFLAMQECPVLSFPGHYLTDDIGEALKEIHRLRNEVKLLHSAIDEQARRPRRGS